MISSSLSNFSHLFINVFVSSRLFYFYLAGKFCFSSLWNKHKNILYGRALPDQCKNRSLILSTSLVSLISGNIGIHDIRSLCYASFRLDRKNYFYVSTFLHFYVSTEKLVHTIIFRRNVETKKRKNSKAQVKNAYLKIGLGNWPILGT